MSNNIFLTGYPGVGKSTIIQKIIKEMAVEPGGYITEFKKEEDQISLYLVDATAILNNKQQLYSNRPFAIRRNRSFLWEVNNSIFNIFAVELLEKGLHSKEVLILDELGRFELGALQFQKKVEEAIQSPKPVLGVIKYERNPFLRRVWDNPEVEVFWVDKENRNEIYIKLLSIFSKELFQ